MAFKPMLASPANFDTLRFPVCVSFKLDGIRATVHDGRLMSRSMKPIPNAWLQSWCHGIPDLEGMDGELIVGAPNEPDTFRRTTSHVMSDDKRDFSVTFHVFDLHNLPDVPYLRRFGHLKQQLTGLPFSIQLHHTVMIERQAALDDYEAEALDQGYEGVMLRDPQGLYKQGRSTAKEQGLLKVKRHLDLEATVESIEERLHNGNAEFTNELGRTARSSAKGGKTGLGTLGALNVRGLLGSAYPGVLFSVGTGLDDAERGALWAERATLPGRIVKVKYFPSGSKDKPRHPVFGGFRDVRDLVAGASNSAATVAAE